MKVNHKVIYSNQKKLFGNEEIIGYGTSEFCVKIIKRKKAVDVIKKNHYSKKVTPNGYLNIGIFIDNCMVGVLMFGHLFNASYHSKIVSGGNSCNAMELNRMWINDNAPKNTASKAISYGIKLIKKSIVILNGYNLLQTKDVSVLVLFIKLVVLIIMENITRFFMN